ncbi:MAG: TetR/AcrR family transcriptional regulator [Acidobacteria bacterium]|nr:TetR/AcrR family transcriptional regulator [Acidobacteriota bacterium]
MGIKERQERDREAVRRAILDAARDLFVSEGFGNVSIRKIAERIEYSPAAIYGYFPSKDDIFFALAEEGFRLLCDSASREETGATPLDRLRAAFRQFYDFSCKHPQYFALMFVDQSVPRISREYERFAFAREKKRHVAQIIQSCIDSGDLPATLNPAVVFRTMTVGLLGVAVMRLSDRLQPGENADDLATDVLNVTLAGLRSGVTLYSKSSVDCPLEERAADAKAS